MQIERPHPKIGALVTGVDVRSLNDEQWHTLYRTWLDSVVMVVRDQTLTKEEFLAYSRRFGRLKPHRVRKTRDPEHAELTVMGIGTRKADGQVNQVIYNRGGHWHTNSPWDDRGLQGHAALWHRHSLDRRRHGVRQHVRGLRVAARQPEAAHRRAEGGIHLWRQEARGP